MLSLAARASLLFPTLAMTAATLLSAVAARGASEAGTAPKPEPEPALVPVRVLPPVAQVASPFDEPLTAPRPADVWLAVPAWRTAYLQVEALALDAPPAGLRRTVHEGELVATAELSPELATRWGHLVGRRVTTERGCTTTIAGLVYLTRALSVDGRFERGYEPTGEQTVVAARLAGCARKLGAYARAAEAAPMAMVARPRPELVEAARAALRASPEAAAAEARWQGEGNPGRWLDSVRWDAHTAVHPETGVTWVAVHAGNPDDGCGATTLQVVLTFSVDADDQLVAHQALTRADALTLQALVDADHDGAPELVAVPWLTSEHVLLRADGAVLDETRVDLHGCPC